MAATATDYAESFLSRAIAAVRDYTDDPAVNKKWTDAKIIRQLELSYILVLGEKNRNALTPAVARFTVTIASSTLTYDLPYTIGTVEAIYQGDGYGGKVFYDSRSSYNPFGKNLWVEGNTLKMQHAGMLPTGTEVTVEYIPSGISRLHNGPCTFTDSTTVVFDATVDQGTLDTHPNAYLGDTFRFLNATGTTVTNNYMQERTITAWAHATRTATIAPALTATPTTDDDELLYEICPNIHKGLDLIVPMHTSQFICEIEGQTTRARHLEKALQKALRHLRLDAYYSNIQEASKLRADNYNNRMY